MLLPSYPKKASPAADISLGVHPQASNSKPGDDKIQKDRTKCRPLPRIPD
jgi:hypothetical protein